MLNGPVASATIRTSFVLVARLVLQAGTLLLVARVLGPSEFGAFAGVAALAMLLGTLSTFGTHLTLLAEASRAYQRRLRVLPYCVTTTLISGALLLVIYLVLIKGIFGGSPISLQLVIVIGLTELFIQPLIGFPSVQLQARRRIVASQLLFLTPLAIRFLVILGLCVYPVEDPLAAFVIGSLIAGTTGLVTASLVSPDTWPAFRHWRFANNRELRRSFGFAVLNITGAGPTEIDKSLAARLLPLATAGIYSGAARIINAVSVPVVAMVQAALPTLFQEAAQAAGIRPRMLTALFGAAFLYGCVAAVAMWMAVPLVAWLFGEAYAGIGQAVTLLCAAIPGTTMRITSGAVLMARGRP